MPGVLIDIGQVDAQGAPVLVEHHLFDPPLLAAPVVVEIDGQARTVLLPADNQPVIVRDEDGVTALTPRHPITRDVISDFRSDGLGYPPLCFLPRLAATYDAGAGPKRVQSSDTDELIASNATLLQRAEAAEKAAEDALAEAKAFIEDNPRTPGAGGGGLASGILWNPYVDGAWRFPTLADAQAAGLVPGVVVRHRAPAGTALPTWTRFGFDEVGLIGADQP